MFDNFPLVVVLSHSFSWNAHGVFLLALDDVGIIELGVMMGNGNVGSVYGRWAYNKWDAHVRATVRYTGAVCRLSHAKSAACNNI